jgi:hypothetical protein
MLGFMWGMHTQLEGEPRHLAVGIRRTAEESYESSVAAQAIGRAGPAPGPAPVSGGPVPDEEHVEQRRPVQQLPVVEEFGSDPGLGPTAQIIRHRS